MIQKKAIKMTSKLRKIVYHKLGLNDTIEKKSKFNKKSKNKNFKKKTRIEFKISIN
jgi:hypothetical protein